MATQRIRPTAIEVFGFTPQADCNNCDGTGYFTDYRDGTQDEACAFCLEDAILRGEVDGTIDGRDYVGGVQQ